MSAAHLDSQSEDVKPRITADAIAAAKNRPIAAVVGALLPIKNGYALCPVHAERTPSLHIDRTRNRFKCFGCGWGGDAIEFIRRVKQVDFAEAVAELAGASPITGAYLPTRAPPPPQSVETPAFVLDLWNSAKDDSLVRWYLESRNILPKSLPAVLRGHKAVWCQETKQKRPAVLAALTDTRDTIVAVQRIWISTSLTYDGSPGCNPKGARALDLVAGKKTWGSMGTSAVRLVEPINGRLGIAEGVETALAAALLYRIPVWAACGGSRLGAVQLPTDVREVIIFGDCGGEAMIAKAESAYQRRGYVTASIMPDRAYRDFAEMRMSR